MVEIFGNEVFFFENICLFVSIIFVWDNIDCFEEILFVFVFNFYFVLVFVMVKLKKRSKGIVDDVNFFIYNVGNCCGFFFWRYVEVILI